MYRTCIFCSADLGINDSVKEFPVGRSIAFDAWKGRLWAVCPKCARWNLAPIEERWEATESAERLFRDSRLRAHSENVGLAKLRDGTRLIRIGEALPGEMAAWRYGRQLASRRTRYLVGAGVLGTAFAGLFALQLAGVVVAVGTVGQFLYYGGVWRHRLKVLKQPVHRLGADESPNGREVVYRLRDMWLTVVLTGEDGALTIRCGSWDRDSPPLALSGHAAQLVLSKALVQRNRNGAGRKLLAAAVSSLAEAGTAGEYVRLLTRTPKILGAPADWARGGSDLTRPETLALEMALHEETERRALEGELAALEAAWREAEEIATIADALPDDPIERLKVRG